MKPYLVASKLEVDVFELAVCRKGGYNVSLADYCYAAIWHKITASWSLAKAARTRHGQIFRLLKTCLQRVTRSYIKSSIYGENT